MNTTPPVSEELKPCPFCGGPGHIESSRLSTLSWPLWKHTDASPLNAAKMYDNREAALVAGNTRASEPYAGQTDVERRAKEMFDEVEARRCANPHMSPARWEEHREEYIRKASALLVSNRSGVEAKLRERVADLELALDLALHGLGEMEPGDSRAVSNEFVAMAAIRCEQDNLDECRDIIRSALDTPTTLEEEG